MEICNGSFKGLYGYGSSYCSPSYHLSYHKENNYQEQKKMNPEKKFFTAFIFLFFFICHLGFAQEIINIDIEKLPEITTLSSRDKESLYKEYQKIVEDNYIALHSSRLEPDILFFKHTFTAADKDTLHWGESQLMSLASRCNITYETIASLNGLECSTEDLIGKTLILPVVPGLFIKENAADCKNNFETLLREAYADQSLTGNESHYNINGVDYVFFMDKRLPSTLRYFFTDSAMGLPLEKGSFWVSSGFGKRQNPVNGQWKDHNGIDLAAAEGTPVYAIKDGYAAYCIEKDATFGNYIILTHDTGKMTSVYAHLSSICVNQYQFVKKGDIIGYVGKTGMATGSHLHFEIRQGGKAQDPQTKLDLK